MKRTKENTCATCLSSDRRLIPLHKIGIVLKHINFTELNTCNTSSICWECKGNIIKFHKFKIKALQAQSILSQNVRLEEVKSLSGLMVKVTMEAANIYQHCYNLDPLTNCDTQPKIEKNIVKEELDNSFNNDDALKTLEVNEEAMETTEQIGNVYVECEIVNNKKIRRNKTDGIVKINGEHLIETIELRNNLNNDEDKISEINKKVIKIDDTDENNCAEADSPVLKKRTIGKSTVDKELEGKFTRIVFSEEEIIKHREDKRNHYNFKKIPFKCDFCVLGFTKEETLRKHMEKKHDKSIGPHKCDICEVRFATESAVASHRWRHSSCYRCTLCKYDTTELWSALNHSNMKHERDHLDSIHCAQCDAVVKTAQELEEHVQMKHRLQCNECGVGFKGKHTLRNHMRRVHARKRKYVCDICARTLPSKSRLESHVASHNTAVAKRLAYCHVCHVQYKNIHVYRNHLKNSANHSERAFSCPECKKKFASKVYWTKHYNFYHLHKSRYSCDICNKLFISDWRLKNHRQKHHGLSRPRDHPCNVCGKQFFSSSTLRNHKLIHSEERSYMCEECGDTFKQRPALYTHAKLVHGDGRRR